MKATEEFWLHSPEELFHLLQSSHAGINEYTAALRLEEQEKDRGYLPGWAGSVALFLRQFKNPLVLLLIFAVILSIFTGQVSDSIIIIAVLLMTGIFSFLQEKHAGDAVASLQSKVNTTASVVRSGRPMEINVSDVVPGDVIVLNAGDIIPADGLLLESNDLHVNESNLTGEAFPVEKFARAYDDPQMLRKYRVLYKGTNVVSGTGMLLSVHTGRMSEFGKIASALRSPETESSQEKGVRQFGMMLLRITIIVSVMIMVLNVMLGKPVISSLLFSLALAVGLTPELLPAILTVTMAAGARRMAEKRVIVKSLKAIPNLGAMDILCADKTGTLTEGKVTVMKCVSYDDTPSDVVERYAYLNAYFESGFSNPLDDAIRTLNLDISGFEKSDEVPYDFIRKRLSIVVTTGESHLMITKGAFGNILSCCATAGTTGVTLRPIEDVKCTAQKLYDEYSAQGLRVIGICWKDVTGDPVINKDDEVNMSLAGMMVLEDPAKSGIVDAVHRLADRGVRLKMITGDNRVVALHLAGKIGLNTSKIITGETIRQGSSEALSRLVGECDVFAEVEPFQKEIIIRALHRNGHTVGFIGDGINDAQALKAADVGISVDRAVDVAKEAADIVLLEHDVDAVTDGVIEGRKTFVNTRKYIHLTTSANFGNMTSMALFSLVLPYLPLLPTQVLLNNLLSDIPALGIAADKVDESELKSPKTWNMNRLRKFMIVFGIQSSIFDFLTFFLLIYLLRVEETTFRTAWFIESLTTEILIIFVIRSIVPVIKSQPSRLLIGLSIFIAAITYMLPYTPAGALLGFAQISPLLLGTLTVIAVAYVFSGELLKRRLIKAWGTL